MNPEGKWVFFDAKSLSLLLSRPCSVLLKDVRTKDSSEGADAPALLLKRSHVREEAAQKTQQAVVHLGKLLQDVFHVSRQLILAAIFYNG